MRQRLLNTALLCLVCVVLVAALVAFWLRLQAQRTRTAAARVGRRIRLYAEQVNLIRERYDGRV